MRVCIWPPQTSYCNRCPYVNTVVKLYPLLVINCRSIWNALTLGITVLHVFCSNPQMAHSCLVSFIDSFLSILCICHPSLTANFHQSIWLWSISIVLRIFKLSTYLFIYQHHMISVTFNFYFILISHRDNPIFRLLLY